MNNVLIKQIKNNIPWIIVVLLSFLFFRICYYVNSPLFSMKYVDSDQAIYYGLAEKMANENKIILSESHANLNSIVYAIFFKLFGSSFKLAIIINIFLLTLCIPLLFLILNELKIPKIFIFLGLLFLFNRHLFRYTKILSEPIFSFTLCMFVYLLIISFKTNKLWISAPFLVFLYYARFVGLGLIPIFVLLILMKSIFEKSLRKFFIFLIIVVGILLPDILIRTKSFGRPFFNTQSALFFIDDYNKYVVELLNKKFKTGKYIVDSPIKMAKDYFKTHSVKEILNRLSAGINGQLHYLKVLYGVIFRNIPIYFLILLGMLLLWEKCPVVILGMFLIFIYSFFIHAWIFKVARDIRLIVPFSVLFLPFCVVPFSISGCKIFKQKVITGIYNIARYIFVFYLLIAYLSHNVNKKTIDGLRYENLMKKRYDEVFFNIHRFLDRIDPNRQCKLMLRQGYFENRQGMLTPPVDEKELFRIIEKEKIDFFIVNSWNMTTQEEKILKGMVSVPKKWQLLVDIKYPLRLKMFSTRNRKIPVEFIYELNNKLSQIQ